MVVHIYLCFHVILSFTCSVICWLFFPWWLSKTSVYVRLVFCFHLHIIASCQWSPCELLNSRDKFRQAPPSSLPHVKYGEVEGCFGVLITLYHIRKLLSSHGVRPAYDMLQEKLRQGYVHAVLLPLYTLVT